MPYADPERKREYDKRRYWENREAQLAEKAEYYRQNREALIAKVKARTDPQAKRQYDREYNQRPLVQVRNAEQRKAWAEANPEKVATSIRRKNHRRRGAKPDADALAYMTILAGDPCSYCGAGFEHVEHITAISRGGTGTWDNLTSSCQKCNYAKRDKSLLRFLAA